ncbi:MAG TPA: YfhO family protein, partial [Anaerolineales bacterium]|nr:YfhO family protein [Anaerolineales bacterium]
EIWVAGGQDALARVLDPGFRPDELVVLEGSRDIRAGSAVGEATVLSGENPNSVVVHVSSEGEAWVVLSDIWYPGWRALVDDREVEIYRADYLFRAVNVPGGDHVVRFEYSPSAFWAGLGLSAIAWLLLMGVVWRQRRV